MMLKIFEEYRESQEKIENRIGKMMTPLLSDLGKRRIFSKMPGLIDLTTLEGSDTQDKVIRLCRQARFSSINNALPDAAAVCIYPSLVKCAVNELKDTGILVASVAGAFPSGQTSLQVRLEDIKYAIGEGADEIDTVISRGKLIEGSVEEVFDELCAIRNICSDVHLKVILETGELPTIAIIRKASELAILAGADFIKTSTGKINAGATPVAFMVMLDTIKEYLAKTGKSVGIKPAGGIRTTGQALVFARLVLGLLGEQWFNKDYFRIGASSLADELIQELGFPKAGLEIAGPETL
jgi:deoxyribose-phosphate aldolase